MYWSSCWAVRVNASGKRTDVGNRLSRIYTRTGDDGTTGLGDGSRVPKDSLRVAAYGTVDELNSAIGIVLASDGVDDAVREALTQVQHELFDLGGELCIPGMAMIEDADIDRLEQVLDSFNDPLPALKDFILPGGGMAAASCHLARTVCRRAERDVISLAHVEDVRPQASRYLNRLSDLLFVICRVLARASGHGEVLWQHERRRKPAAV
jgi:cob(I)alamin adenosyltransferase